MRSGGYLLVSRFGTLASLQVLLGFRGQVFQMILIHAKSETEQSIHSSICWWLVELPAAFFSPFLPWFVPLLDWTLPLHGHCWFYIFTIWFKTTLLPATSSSLASVVWLVLVGFQSLLPMQLGIGQTQRWNVLLQYIQSHHFGNKLLPCFAFEIATVFTNNDSINALSSSHEVFWDKDIWPES